MTVLTNHSFHQSKPRNNLSFELPSRRGVGSTKETNIMKILNPKTYCFRTLSCFPRGDNEFFDGVGPGLLYVCQFSCRWAKSMLKSSNYV